MDKFRNSQGSRRTFRSPSLPLPAARWLESDENLAIAWDNPRQLSENLGKSGIVWESLGLRICSLFIASLYSFQWVRSALPFNSNISAFPPWLRFVGTPGQTFAENHFLGRTPSTLSENSKALSCVSLLTEFDFFIRKNFLVISGRPRPARRSAARRQTTPRGAASSRVRHRGPTCKRSR